MSETLALTRWLIEQPSVTPDDHGCQSHLAARLAQLGFKIEYFNHQGVTNLWALLDRGGPVFCFAGHTDVVPAGDTALWRHPPFQGTKQGGYLYGRGAVDMKSALAAMVIAIERFIATHPTSTSLAMLLTSDEEGPARDGTQHALACLAARGQKIDYCVVGEPSCAQQIGDTIRHGRRGSLHGELVIHGKQGHVAYPETVVNPLHQILQPLHDLAQYTWDTGDEAFPPTSFQVTYLTGGVAKNVVPATAQATFNWRFSPSLTVEMIQDKTHALLAPYGLDYEIQWHVSGQPFVTAPNGLLVNALGAIIKDYCGITPHLSTGGGTSDARFFAPYVKEVIEFGHLNATLHQVNERVAIDDLDKLTDIYYLLLESVCLAAGSATSSRI